MNAKLTLTEVWSSEQNTSYNGFS